MRPARPSPTRRWSAAALTTALLSASLVGAVAVAPVHAASSAVAAPHPPVEGADGVVRDWLSEANYLRGFWNLPVPQLVEDPELSRRNALHAAYDTRNGSCGHGEEPGNPHYTADGDYAAKHSVLWCGPVRSASAVDGWVRTPFHGEQVLNPRLTVTGFSDAEERSGMDTLTHYRAGPAVTAAMSWPNGPDFPLRQWWGSEIPDPLETSCPAEYAQRNREVTTGQPLFAVLPEADRTAGAREVRFGLSDGTQLPYCLLPHTSLFLSTAILMPLDPLRPGTRYVASYAAGASTARWDFTTSRAQTSATLDGPASLGAGQALTLTGTLRSDEDSRRSGEEREPSMSGEAVSLLADGQAVADARTDAEGAFTFTLPYRKASWTVRYEGTGAYAPTSSAPFVTAFDPTPLETTLRLSASPAPATFGSSVRVAARLVSHAPEDASATSAVAGQPVALQVQQADGSWATVATPTTDSAGLVGTVRTADRNRRYRAVYAGEPGRYAAATTVVGQSPVALRLTGLGVARTSARSATWTGTAAPGGGRVVTLQYRPGSGYLWTASTRVRSDSAGRFRLVGPVYRGSWEYRVVVAGTPDAHVGATGPARRFAG